MRVRARERVIVVVPAYQVEPQVGEFLAGIPDYIHKVVVVNDASTDGTARVLASAAVQDNRIVVVHRPRNGGVGAAVTTGFHEALRRRATIIVKMDGDGQMAWSDLPRLLRPILQQSADCAKGNRFRDFQALRRMPPVRRLGNMVLSFLCKAATGYWNLFDPTNGFIAMRAEVVKLLRVERLDPRYFFEQSLLAELYLIGAVIADVDLPARYGTERSNLPIKRVALQFPPKLTSRFIRRIWIRKFLYDFNMGSVYLLVSVPMLLFAIIFGGFHWMTSLRTGLPAPTGTVMLPTLLAILAVQFLLAAVELDIRSVPTRPVTATLDADFDTPENDALIDSDFLTPAGAPIV